MCIRDRTRLWEGEALAKTPELLLSSLPPSCSIHRIPLLPPSPGSQPWLQHSMLQGTSILPAWTSTWALSSGPKLGCMEAHEGVCVDRGCWAVPFHHCTCGPLCSSCSCQGQHVTELKFISPSAGLSCPTPSTTTCSPEWGGSLPTAHRFQSVEPLAPAYVSVYVSACKLVEAEILSFPPSGSACSPEPDPRGHSGTIC